MKHAELLAALRQHRNDDQVRECLAALASSMHADDPVCMAIDAAIAAIEDNEESLRLVAQDRADDMHNKRHGADQLTVGQSDGAVPMWQSAGFVGYAG